MDESCSEETYKNGFESIVVFHSMVDSYETTAQDLERALQINSLDLDRIRVGYDSLRLVCFERPFDLDLLEHKERPWIMISEGDRERAEEDEFQRGLRDYSINLKTLWPSFPADRRIVEAYHDRIKWVNHMQGIVHRARFETGEGALGDDAEYTRLDQIKNILYYDLREYQQNAYYARDFTPEEKECVRYSIAFLHVLLLKTLTGRYVKMPMTFECSSRELLWILNLFTGMCQRDGADLFQSFYAPSAHEMNQILAMHGLPASDPIHLRTIFRQCLDHMPQIQKVAWIRSEKIFCLEYLRAKYPHTPQADNDHAVASLGSRRKRRGM